MELYASDNKKSFVREAITPMKLFFKGFFSHKKPSSLIHATRLNGIQAQYFSHRDDELLEMISRNWNIELEEIRKF